MPLADSEAAEVRRRAPLLEQGAGRCPVKVAQRAQKKQTSMTMTRASLIHKGIIYPPSQGRVAFTVPGMADYISRLKD